MQLDHISTLIEFLYVASLLVGKLPIWENSLHNHTKLDLTYRLRQGWKEVIVGAAQWTHVNGPILSKEMVLQWSKWYVAL
jgi:hypothetical protein